MSRITIFITILILFVASLSISAQQVYPSSASLDTTLLELPEIGEDEHIVIHTGYISSFDLDGLIPKWVAYQLTIDELQGTFARKGSFQADTTLPFKQASNSDYRYSGYDKGHMAPAADMKWSDNAMMESFFFTNMCPQKPKLNRYSWLALEKIVRFAAENYGGAWVISGPLMHSRDSVVTIGEDSVVVPHAFFKAILSPKDSGYVSIGFIMENTDDPQPALEKMITVDALEDSLGMNLFKCLPAKFEYAESVLTPSDWGL